MSHKYKVGDIVWVKIPPAKDIKNRKHNKHFIAACGGCSCLGRVSKVLNQNGLNNNNNISGWHYNVELSLLFPLELNNLSAVDEKYKWSIAEEWIDRKIK
jgi:hypothetical protein